MIDQSVVDELHDALGDELGEIFGEYLAQLFPQVQQIGEGLVQGDLERGREEAHSLKGSSGNLGVMGVAEVAADIERACREHNLDAARVRYQDLLSCAEATVSALNAKGFFSANA